MKDGDKKRARVEISPTLIHFPLNVPFVKPYIGHYSYIPMMN